MTIESGDLLNPGVLPIGILHEQHRGGAGGAGGTGNAVPPGLFPAATRNDHRFQEFTDASARSIELMKEWLSPKQRQEYEDHQQFTVIGNHTGTAYKILPLVVYGIVEMRNGYVKRRYCIVPDGRCAAYVGDIMLAQKIMLETNEREALKIANYH